jgi:hypothetical protein
VYHLARSCERTRMKNERVVLTSLLCALSLTGHREIVTTFKVIDLRRIFYTATWLHH